MNHKASVGETDEQVKRTPKIVFVGLGVLFLLAISVPFAWLYVEIANFRDQGTQRESSSQKVQSGGNGSDAQGASHESSQVAIATDSVRSPFSSLPLSTLDGAPVGPVATVLTAEQAKLALVNMIQQSNDKELGDQLRDLKGATPMPTDVEGVVVIGIWKCDLRNETFSSRARPFLFFSGKFWLDGNGYCRVKELGKGQF